jgi:hypothetical protein
VESTEPDPSPPAEVPVEGAKSSPSGDQQIETEGKTTSEAVREVVAEAIGEHVERLTSAVAGIPAEPGRYWKDRLPPEQVEAALRPDYPPTGRPPSPLDPFAQVGSLEVQHEPMEDGTVLVVVERADRVVDFAREMLEDADGIFLEVAGGFITVTGANGRWRYRPVGSSSTRIRAVLESEDWNPTLKGPLWRSPLA